MVARSTHTTERCGTGSARQLFVPVDDTGAAFQPELLVARFGIRQQTRSQTILSVVGLGNRPGKISVADHLQQWAEQLFILTLGHAGYINDAWGQQGGLSLRLSHFQQRHRAIGQHPLLGIHQGFGRAEGNHRPHERWRLLVECTDFNRRTDRHQTRQQGIAPGAFGHQQTPGARAALASRNECRLNNGVDRRIHIGHFIDHQWVVATHFQGQDLVRAPGELLVQMVAGAAGASEEQPVNARVGRQGDTGFPRTLQQVQHARRQTGFNPALHGQLGDFGGQFARFEQHRVTRQQGRDNMPVRQMAREVVRAEHRHHTVGLVAQYGRGVAQRAALFAGTFAVALHRDGNLVGHAGDFGGRFPQRLAGFLTDATGDFIGARFQRGGKGFQHADAFFQRAAGPAWKCLTRRLHGRLDLLGSGAITSPQHLLGHRVARLKQLTLAGQPATCDIQRIHYFDSRAADSATART